MTTTHVEVGQEYDSCQPTASMPGKYYIRIRIIERPVPGAFGEGKVRVATVTDDGREIRPRYLATRQLHNDPKRRTGYRLVTPDAAR